MSRASGAPGKRPLRHAAGALLVMVAFAQAPVTVLASDTRKELDRAKKELQALRDEYKDVEQRLAIITAELQSLLGQISQATAQVEALRAAIDAAKVEIRRSEKAATRLQEDLNSRARETYMRGPAGAINLILEAQSLGEMTARFSFLENLAEADAETAQGLQTEKEQIVQLKADLKTYLEDIERVLERLSGQRAEFEAKQAEQQAVQKELEGAIEKQREIVSKLEKKLQEELLARYAFAGNPAAPPVDADGPFYWCPVGAPRSYIDDFGFPRVGHTHQGNDIFAPEGTPIHAPFEGTAEEGLDGLGGIVVHVYASANADYVYNAHLVRHAGVDGATVKPGDLIGYVGNTGNAAGTPPHDHFEYHPGGGSAVSPYIYLNEVCGVGGAG